MIFKKTIEACYCWSTVELGEDISLNGSVTCMSGQEPLGDRYEDKPQPGLIKIYFRCRSLQDPRYCPLNRGVRLVQVHFTENKGRKIHVY